MSSSRLKKYFFWHLHSPHRLLGLILLFAFIIRAIGIGHSFPHILHPDEPAVVRAALDVRFNLNPMHFDWPHLFIYLNYFVYMIFAHFRALADSANLKPFIEAVFPLMWNDSLVFYWVSRLFSVLFAVFTIIPVYLAAKRLFTQKIALFSALTMAIIPFHVWHSQYALIDAPMMFFGAWALYFSTGILQSRNVRNYILAGLFVGFSASTKYNGGAFALVILLAHISRVYRLKEEKLLSYGGVVQLVCAGAFSLLGFFIGTPYAFLDYETFSRTDGPKGAYWQFTNVGKVTLPVQVFKFGFLFISKLPRDFSFGILFSYLVGAGILLNAWLRRVNLENKLSLTFLYVPSLLFFLYIAGFANSRSHYYFIAYPFVAILSSYTFGILLNYFDSQKAQLLKWIFIIIYWGMPAYMIFHNTQVRLSDYTQVGSQAERNYLE